MNPQKDYSSIRTRQLLLNRGLTNRRLAEELKCSPRTVRGIVNGEPARCAGKAADRMLQYLRQNHPPVAEELVLVTKRRVRRERRTVEVVR
jgi:predicted transcriptional regulator